jgi:hypothetical protein
MMLGEVDKVDDHYIATKFVGLVIPVSSMYVTSYSSSRHGNVTTMRWGGVPIRFNWKSAALAYPRVWLWFLAAAWPFLTHWGENVDTMTSSTWLTMAGLAVAAVLFHLPGRLSAREKRRLMVLGGQTGLRIDPTKLDPIMRAMRRDVLEANAKQEGLPTTPAECAAAAKDTPSASLGLLYALTRYSGDDPEWRAASNAVLARIEGTA